MSSVTRITCAACGKQFELTPDYLSQYGGQTTTCDCGEELAIPAASPLTTATPTTLSYAAPAVGEKLPTEVFRDGKHLVVRIGVKLPRRCAVCGQPLNYELRPTQLSIVRPGEPGVGMGGAAGMLARAAAAERVMIRFGYCPDHAPWISHHTAKLLFPICIVACVPLLLAAGWFASNNNTPLGISMLAVPGAIFVVGGIVFGARFGRQIEGVSIDRGYAWLTGFGKGYLALFPTLEEAHAQSVAHTAQALDRLTD